MRDAHNRPLIAVTGLGVITSLGEGKDVNWARLTSGHSGIKPITRFSVENLRTTIAGTIDLEATPLPAPILTYELARRAAHEAITQSNLPLTHFDGPLFLGMPPVEMEWPNRLELATTTPTTYDTMIAAIDPNKHKDWHKLFLFGTIGEKLADDFGITGMPISMSTACATGATAIQMAVEALRRGECSRALAIGTDGSISAESLVRFSLLSALSTRNDPATTARPFSKDRDGFVMAEGSGALVLETLEAALSRGATILGLVSGCGEMADSFHRTRSSPDGKPIIGCMMNALEDAALTPNDIDYVNAHGTSTPENDKMEYLGMAAVFGERLALLPVSSNKSMIGHTLSAAGAIEAVFSLLTIANEILPPTINYETPDPAVPLDVVPNVARKAKPKHVISNSFGFGGQNVSLIFSKYTQ